MREEQTEIDIGDWVRLIRIPKEAFVHEDYEEEDLETLEIFRFCLGRTYQVVGFFRDPEDGEIQWALGVKEEKAKISWSSLPGLA